MRQSPHLSENAFSVRFQQQVTVGPGENGSTDRGPVWLSKAEGGQGGAACRTQRELPPGASRVWARTTGLNPKDWTNVTLRVPPCEEKSRPSKPAPSRPRSSHFQNVQTWWKVLGALS